MVARREVLLVVQNDERAEAEFLFHCPCLSIKPPPTVGGAADTTQTQLGVTPDDVDNITAHKYKTRILAY